MGVLWEYLEKNGRMVDVYTDRHSMFTVSPRPGESKDGTARGRPADATGTSVAGVGNRFHPGLGGSAPPGSPIGAIQGNFALIGGSGAFMGVRGHGGATLATTPIRQASMTEDPANRRINVGGKMSFVFQLFPEERPQVIALANGPAIVHSSNFQPVSTANPAHSGEMLTLFATGLGPVRAAINPGQPFPPSPLDVVNSPVAVRVNGTDANVLYAGGYPGAVDGYQVNFTLPSGVAPHSCPLR